jgi:hypothetical protein
VPWVVSGYASKRAAPSILSCVALPIRQFNLHAASSLSTFLCLFARI